MSVHRAQCEITDKEVVLVKWETAGSDLSLPPNQSEGLGSFALTTIRKTFRL